MGRVREALSATLDGGDAVSVIFDGVFKFAGTQSLSDDATAVMVSW
jgi:hypothetical protein